MAAGYGAMENEYCIYKGSNVGSPVLTLSGTGFKELLGEKAQPAVALDREDV